MADLQKTIDGLEEFGKNLKSVGDWYELGLVNDAVELLNEQKATIDRLKRTARFKSPDWSNS